MEIPRVMWEHCPICLMSEVVLTEESIFNSGDEWECLSCSGIFLTAEFDTEPQEVPHEQFADVVRRGRRRHPDGSSSLFYWVSNRSDLNS